MASNRVIEFSRYRICINEHVYEPAEDTKILLDLLKINQGDKVLDMGSGSGILGYYAIRKGAKVTFIDINPYATEATLCTLKLNNVNPEKFDIINCDLLSCLRNDVIYDVAIFNPPYLPFEEYNSWIGYSWSGGKNGIEVIMRFFNNIRAKRIYIVVSSLSDFDKLFIEVKRMNYKITDKREITIGYETIMGLELVADDTTHSRGT
ncbi:HemK2/MTQ2 family protein methyltransferase [Stygiolobus azoricus]|uniref:Methyltransferase n=1 Tax=Stygiolobus azoricus TaxID=41675 RepID=A0A650CM85_9CREN|nr:HemK2/MTQ2 family protein methyltransferase [Stygiolobus azoricus]QGR18893.1 methyltransferase [Stygiolobus azoricus]